MNDPTPESLALVDRLIDDIFNNGGQPHAAARRIDAHVAELRELLIEKTQVANDYVGLIEVRDKRISALRIEVIAMTRRIAAYKARLDEQKDIVARIWKQLGNPSYEELAGRTIYDLIDELLAARAPPLKPQQLAPPSSEGGT